MPEPDLSVPDELLSYFAGQTLNGIISARHNAKLDQEHAREKIARKAWDMAETMIEVANAKRRENTGGTVWT